MSIPSYDILLWIEAGYMVLSISLVLCIGVYAVWKNWKE